MVAARLDPPLSPSKREHMARVAREIDAPGAAEPWCCPRCGCSIARVGAVWACMGLSDPGSIQKYIEHWNMSHWRADPPKQVDPCGWHEPASAYGKDWVCPPR